MDFEIVGPNDPKNDGDSPSTPDLSCIVDAGAASCTASYTGNNEGTDLIRGWIDHDKQDGSVEADLTEVKDDAPTAGSIAEPDTTDVVEKVWTVLIECTPETETVPTGALIATTCTATDALGAAVPGSVIKVEYSGVNDPDATSSPATPDDSCVADGSGSCSLLHGDESSERRGDLGQTIVTVWAGPVPDPLEAPDASADPSREPEAGSGQPGERPEPDQTDLVTKTWVPNEARLLDCDEAGQGDADDDAVVAAPAGVATFDCQVTDEFGNPTGDSDASQPGQQTVTVFGEVRGPEDSARGGTGINDPDDPDSTSLGSPDYSCEAGKPGVTGQTEGRCTISIDRSEGEGGTTALCFFIVLTHTPTGTQSGPACDNESGPPHDEPEGNDSADQARVVYAPSSIRLNPLEAVNAPRSTHTVSATVLDAAGAPMEGVTVVWGKSGVGQFVTTETTTDSDGVAVAVVTSDVVGDATITAFTERCAPESDCYEEAVAHWGPGRCTVFGTRSRDVLRGGKGRDVICGFGGKDVLRGRAGKDRLIGGPGRDRLEGNSGADRIEGGAGADTLLGGAGRDRLIGGRGRDRCRGGRGRDVTRSCERKR